MGPWGGSAGGLRAPGRRCCTFARAPRRQKPRNLEEKRFRWRPLSRSHVRRPPSTHMGARQLHMTTDGKTHDPAGNRPPSRKGPTLPCATLRKDRRRPPPPPHAHPRHSPGGSAGALSRPVPHRSGVRSGWSRPRRTVGAPQGPRPPTGPDTPHPAAGALPAGHCLKCADTPQSTPRSVHIRAVVGAADQFTRPPDRRGRWRRSPPPGRGCRWCRRRSPPRAAAGSGPARRRPAAGRPRRWRRRPPRD